MYKIFADFHHSSLLNSLILLFEKRLGGEVYRPIGKEWHIKGFWKVYDHPATVEQFLGVGGATPDGSPKLNEINYNDKNIMAAKAVESTGVFKCNDVESGNTNKAITFNGFMSRHFDVVIASIPQHIEPFRKLCDLHPDHPKLIYQIGNNWNISPDQEKMIDAILASARLTVRPNIPFIEYHQEFDLNIFRPTNETNNYQIITSFVNCFNTDQLFAADWDIFTKVEQRMTDWQFRVFGGGCRDGNASGSQNLANEMRRSRFIWHTKNAGDGYGHIIHNAAAVARPLIVKKSHYIGKLGADLMTDGETCIAIDGLSIDEIVKKIEYYNDPARYAVMRKGTYNNFLSRVDFNTEADNIRQLLENLI